MSCRVRDDILSVCPSICLLSYRICWLGSFGLVALSLAWRLWHGALGLRLWPWGFVGLGALAWETWPKGPVLEALAWKP